MANRIIECCLIECKSKKIKLNKEAKWSLYTVEERQVEYRMPTHRSPNWYCWQDFLVTYRAGGWLEMSYVMTMPVRLLTASRGRLRRGRQLRHRPTKTTLHWHTPLTEDIVRNRQERGGKPYCCLNQTRYRRATHTVTVTNNNSQYNERTNKYNLLSTSTLNSYVKSLLLMIKVEKGGNRSVNL